MSTTFKFVLAIIAAVLAFAGFVFGMNRIKTMKKHAPKKILTFCLKTERKAVSTYGTEKDKAAKKLEDSALSRYFAEKKAKKAERKAFV